MVNKLRSHVPMDSKSNSDLAPKHLLKQEFGQRIYRLMLANGWNQSQLAKRADLPRDSISTYIRGVTMPTPQSVKKLADVLNVEPHELMPNHVESAIEHDEPAIEIRASASAPGISWLRINRAVSTATALKIAMLLEGDNAFNGKRSGDEAPVLDDKD